MNICHLVDARITPALRTFGLPEATTAMTTPSTRPEFGDYQVNGIMAAARFLGENPRELAQSVLDQVDFSDVADKAQVAGSGFINIYLKNSWLAEQCLLAAHDKRLGIARVTHPLKIVVDYSGPNLAKEMHVGHLRSTIIGDSLVRVLSFLGHDVIPQNHVGDWGTQFGMLIANTPALESTSGDSALSLADLEALYQQAQQRFEEEPSFASAARECLVRLQSGDKECLRIWRQLVDISLDHLDEVYEKLNLKLSRASLKPESSYNPDLETIVRELQAAGLVTESDGAQCSFLEEFQDDNGYSTPVIVKKSDGGYTYATTDLAALSYRSSSLNANRVLYFADARQTLHFRQVFTLARKARS